MMDEAFHKATGIPVREYFIGSVVEYKGYGVSFEELDDRPDADRRYLIFIGADGYVTNDLGISRELTEDCKFVTIEEAKQKCVEFHGEVCKRLRRKYNRILDNLKIKARGGDKEAAIQIIGKLAEFYGALKDLGYRITDEDESKPNRLVPITKEWVEAKLAAETEADKLLRRIRAGDASATREYILLMAKQQLKILCADY